MLNQFTEFFNNCLINLAFWLLQQADYFGPIDDRYTYLLEMTADF